MKWLRDYPVAVDREAVAGEDGFDVLLAEARGVVLDIDVIERGGEMDVLYAVCTVDVADGFFVGVS